MLPLWAASVAAIAADIALGTAWYGASSTSGPYSYGSEAGFSGGPVTLLVSFALLAPSISAAVTRGTTPAGPAGSCGGAWSPSPARSRCSWSSAARPATRVPTGTTPPPGRSGGSPSRPGETG